MKRCIKLSKSKLSSKSSHLSHCIYSFSINWRAFSPVDGLKSRMDRSRRNESNINTMDKLLNKLRNDGGLYTESSIDSTTSTGKSRMLNFQLLPYEVHQRIISSLDCRSLMSLMETLTPTQRELCACHTVTTQDEIRQVSRQMKSSLINIIYFGRNNLSDLEHIRSICSRGTRNLIILRYSEFAGKVFDGDRFTIMLNVLSEAMGHICDVVLLNDSKDIRTEMLIHNVVFPAKSKVFIVSQGQTKLVLKSCDASGKFEIELKPRYSNLTGFRIALKNCSARFHQYFSFETLQCDSLCHVAAQDITDRVCIGKNVKEFRLDAGLALTNAPFEGERMVLGSAPRKNPFHSRRIEPFCSLVAPNMTFMKINVEIPKFQNLQAPRLRHIEIIGNRQRNVFSEWYAYDYETILLWQNWSRFVMNVAELTLVDFHFPIYALSEMPELTRLSIKVKYTAPKWSRRPRCQFPKLRELIVAGRLDSVYNLPRLDAPQLRTLILRNMSFRHKKPRILEDEAMNINLPRKYPHVERLFIEESWNSRVSNKHSSIINQFSKQLKQLCLLNTDLADDSLAYIFTNLSMLKIAYTDPHRTEYEDKAIEVNICASNLTELVIQGAKGRERANIGLFPLLKSLEVRRVSRITIEPGTERDLEYRNVQLVSSVLLPTNRWKRSRWIKISGERTQLWRV